MFCRACGKQIDNGSTFCEHCGARQSAAAGQPASQWTPPTSVQPEPQSVPQPRKPMSAKTKIILGVVAGLVVAVLGGKVILNSMNDPSKTIRRFVDAIRDQDAAAFSRVVSLQATDPDLKLNEETLAPFFARYSQSTDALNSFQRTLQEDLVTLKRGLQPDYSNFIRLTKKSNPLFSSYRVELAPSQVSMSSEFDNTTLTIGGNTYLLGRKDKTVELLPGYYDASISCISDTTGVTLNRDFSEVSISPGSDYREFYFDYSTADIGVSSSAIELKEVDIDGYRYTGDLTESYYDYYISPVNSDSQIRVVYSFAGLEFEQSFSMANGSGCLLEPNLPDELVQSGKAMASAIAPLILQLGNSYSLELLEELENNYGASSPELVSSWNETVLTNREYNDEHPSYATYGVYNGLAPGEVTASESLDYGDIRLSCRVPLTYSARTYYRWDTNEVSREYSGGSLTARVDMIYSNNQWVVTSVS